MTNDPNPARHTLWRVVRTCLFLVPLLGTAFTLITSLLLRDTTTIAITSVLLLGPSAFAIGVISLAIRSPSHPLALVHVTCFVAIFATTLFRPFYRPVFYLNRHAFSAAAAEIHRGATFDQPRWIGTVRVLDGKLCHTGMACFRTEDRPNGDTYISDANCNTPPRSPWYTIELDKDWCFTVED